MATYHQSTEREQAARQRLYDYNVELRAIVLDLLSIVRASSDPWPASASMPVGEPERLRQQAFDVEHQDAIITRARRMIDTTSDAGRYIGPLPRTDTAQKQPTPTATEGEQTAPAEGTGTT